MNAINSKKGSTYHMEAPEIADDAGKTKKTIFPVYEAVEPTISSNKATVNVCRQVTIVKCGTLAAGLALTLVPDAANLNVGSVVVVTWTNPSSKVDVTVKVGEDTIATLVGVNSATVSKQLIWDGSGFLTV